MEAGAQSASATPRLRSQQRASKLIRQPIGEAEQAEAIEQRGDDIVEDVVRHMATRRVDIAVPSHALRRMQEGLALRLTGPPRSAGSAIYAFAMSNLLSGVRISSVKQSSIATEPIEPRDQVQRERRARQIGAQPRPALVAARDYDDAEADDVVIAFGTRRRGRGAAPSIRTKLSIKNAL